MENSNTLNIIEKTIIELEKENKNLKLKIKDAHIDNACLELNFNNIKPKYLPKYLYKMWSTLKLLRDFILQK